MAEQQDPLGGSEGVGECLEVFVRLGPVDVEATGWVAVVVKDVVVHTAGIWCHDLLRRWTAGRIDRIDPRMVEVSHHNGALASNADNAVGLISRITFSAV
jgi:hypothetical protein